MNFTFQYHNERSNGMATQDNLAAAFAGESQANRKYLAFAERAEKDGFPNVAKLFRAAAAAETVHAHAHLRAMGGINDTAQNLQAAAEGEAYEFNEMYPPFLREAQKEGNRRAENSFKYALEAEGIHYGLYQEALESVKKGNDLQARKIYICPVCGHTVYDDVPEECPICGVKGEKFEEIL